ncbi:2-oxo-4-hydroxy-4-carboxy-5-ureidoimidazoline decarboxylase [Nocardiopsis sediminis]|uniref:2-oxo-4-hydroxy-4-carboxy-5-ureidoimidazoline decarboxylase n=1 Tax=Nocardiopsis sediminis TaxID=1778267 RepID=A0ABV8FHB6_9ACTN
MADSTAPAEVADPGVRRVNELPDDRFRAELAQCLDIGRWVEALLSARPFADRAALVAAADAHARTITDDEADAALARHPRIGERAPGKDAEAAWSRSEQSGFADGEAAVREAFAAGQAAYERRFGRIYLVCASGLSGTELLDGLRARMGNDPAEEARVVADELRKIALLRIGKVLGTP